VRVKKNVASSMSRFRKIIGFKTSWNMYTFFYPGSIMSLRSSKNNTFFQHPQKVFKKHTDELPNERDSRVHETIYAFFGENARMRFSQKLRTSIHFKSNKRNKKNSNFSNFFEILTVTNTKAGKTSQVIFDFRAVSTTEQAEFKRLYQSQTEDKSLTLRYPFDFGSMVRTFPEELL
jgi:hypothetical protein